MAPAKRGWRAALMAVVGMVTLLTSPAFSALAQDPTVDALSFDIIVLQLPAMTPLNTPASGQFDATKADSVAAGVSVADGVAHAEFSAPQVTAGATWAMAVIFRNSVAAQDILLIFGDGSWTFDGGNTDKGESGEGIAIDSTPGALNTVDVVFNGDEGLFGVNGVFADRLDLSAYLGPGDVLVTGYLGPGVGQPLMSYSNFAVYQVPDSSTPVGLATDVPPTVTAQPTETPVSTPTVVGDPAATFDQLRIDAISRPVIYGPVDDVLPHDEQSVTFSDAGVNVTDFAARIECVAPRSAAEGPWDCGLAFRDLSSANHYRLGVISDGNWFLSIGSKDPDQFGQGTPIVATTGDKLAIDLIVVGDIGYFGVNGEFVSTLDLSEITGPGSVAAVTGFFADTFIQGGETPYEDFIIWNFDKAPPDGATPIPATESAESPTAQASGTPGQATPAAVLPGVAGNSYTSPTFGYGFSWDVTWTVEDASSEGGFDFLRLTNGVVTSDLYGAASDMTPADCISSLLQFYKDDPAYSNVAFAIDANNRPLFTPGADLATALISFTYTENGTAVDYLDYAACSTLPGQGALVTLENYVEPGEFVNQSAAIDDLQSRLDIASIIPDVPVLELTPSAETTSAATEVPVTPPPAEVAVTASFTLDPVNGSGVSGVGTIEGQARGVSLTGIVLKAEPGSVVAIYRGACDSISTAGDPDYFVGEVDEGGIVQEEVRVRLTVLLTRDIYSVAVFPPGDELTQVLACGEIVSS